MLLFTHCGVWGVISTIIYSLCGVTYDWQAEKIGQETADANSQFSIVPQDILRKLPGKVVRERIRFLHIHTLRSRTHTHGCKKPVFHRTSEHIAQITG